MSHDPRNQAQVLEQERRRLSQRLDEVARLCEAPIPPSAFYSELLQRLLESLAAPGGCVWVRTPQGNLQQAFQTNFQQAGLDGNDEARMAHDALLRMVFTSGQPIHLPPRSSIGEAKAGQVAPGNPTGFMLLIVPIKLNDQVCGLIEVLQGPNRPANAVPGFLQYMGMMADNASRYQRNQLMSQLTGQQALWTQLEAFARAIHGSLTPTEVSYHVANEGRRLIECDRLTVVLRPRGEYARVEAVSGADVVEQRSNQVQKLRALSQAVLDWGERLVFNGTKDDSLPPRVLTALDEYIAESPSRQLVIVPLSDERDGDGKEKEKQPPRSALVMECYEAPADPQQTIARLDVVARHATSALYNTLEYNRIPFRFIWMPLALIQEGLGGQTRAIIVAVVAALSLIGTALYALPYPLRIDSNGKMLPVVRRKVYPPSAGRILDFHVNEGDLVGENRDLATLEDTTLYEKLIKLQEEMDSAEQQRLSKQDEANKATAPGDQARLRGQAQLHKIQRDAKRKEIKALLERTNGLKGQPGKFALRAPEMTASERGLARGSRWKVLTSDFKSKQGSEARPNEPIMNLGAINGPWEVELKIPQKHHGQVLKAFERLKPGQPLMVDFLMATDTTRLYKGALYRNRVAGEATASQDAASDSEPVVIAYVVLDDEAIPEDYRVPREMLTSDTDVKAKVICGNHRAGYSLFYGVWEFFYEKVVFFF